MCEDLIGTQGERMEGEGKGGEGRERKRRRERGKRWYSFASFFPVGQIIQHTTLSHPHANHVRILKP